MNNNRKVIGIVSLGLAVFQFFFFVSFFIYKSSTLQGLPVLLPIFIAPIGIFLGAIGSSSSEVNKQARYGFRFNLIMLMLPFAYMILGTLLFGP